MTETLELFPEGSKTATESLPRLIILEIYISEH